MSDIMIDDRYSGALEPDTMVPEQFFAGLRRKAGADGERRLMVAVLEDAVSCFRKNLFATDPKARQLFVDAEAWITTEDRTWFFAFDNVCETLDLDPHYVRKGLLRWRDREQRAQERGTATQEVVALRKVSGA